MERATDDRFKELGWQFGAAEPEASLSRRSGRNVRNGTPVSGVLDRRQRASRLADALRYRRKGRKHVERSRCPAAAEGGRNGERQQRPFPAQSAPYRRGRIPVTGSGNA
jgi:hypothetical protein